MKGIGRIIGGIIVAVGLCAGVAMPAAANDSEAEIGLGGLTLTRSDAIRMDSERLVLSRDRVSVDYVFTNTTASDVDTLVAFPLPDIVNGIEVPVPDYGATLGFRTTVDGKPAQLTLTQTARFKGADIGPRLAALGIPLAPIAEVYDKAVNRLSEGERKKLVAEGLISDAGSSGTENYWYAHWTTSTSVTRRQVFPAAKSIAVSHSYKPFVGGSVGGRLDPSERKSAEFAAARAKFCIDDDFIRALDRRIAAGKGKVGYSEAWIGYVLTSGANWKGPIADFRMTIDKGDPQALVSFCGTGVKKIGPTRFEVAYRDFVPKSDVSVLIVSFYENP